MAKRRLDQLLVERGLAPSRARAQSLILAGRVLVEDNPNVKSGQQFDEAVSIRMKVVDHPYVSRGGLKLEAALDQFQIPVEGRIALDVGISTGGFSHVLLLRGVVRIHGVDVGHNQLDWRLRQDPKVLLKEGVNARHLQFDQIGEKVNIIVVDVSFISLDKILPALLAFADRDTDWVTLIKPQFEVGKEKVGKGGIVSSEEDQNAAVERITQVAKVLGLRRSGLIQSPILGTEGNREFLAHWKLD